MVKANVKKAEVVGIGNKLYDLMITRTVEQHSNGTLTMSGTCPTTGIPILYINPMKLTTINQELN